MVKRTVLAAIMVMLVTTLVFGSTPAAAQSEGRIAGIVYNDKNGNGIREEGEEGVFDTRINFQASGWDVSLNTEQDGSFSLDVNPATWTVTVIDVPDGYNEPDPASVDVTIENAGDSVTNLEFGLVPAGAEQDVLPASGSPIPGPAIIAGLIAIMLIGAGLFIIGQRKASSAA